MAAKTKKDKKDKKKDKDKKKSKKKDKDEKKDKKKSKKKDKDKDEKKNKKKDKDKGEKKSKKKDKGEKKSKSKDKEKKKDKDKGEKKKPKTYSVADIAEKADVDPREMKAFFDQFRRRLEKMKVGAKIRVQGICNFEKIETNPRVSRNPRTGEKVDVPAKKKIRVRISANLKDL